MAAISEPLLQPMSRVAIAQESVYPTITGYSEPTTNNWSALSNPKFTPDISKNILNRIGVLSTNARKIGNKKTIGKIYGGTLEGELQHSRILQYVVGDSATTGGGDPFTHTFVEAQNPLKSFAMETAFAATTDYAVTYDGCMVRQLTVTMNAGDPVIWAFDLSINKTDFTGGAFPKKGSATAYDTTNPESKFYSSENSTSGKLDVSASKATPFGAEHCILTLENSAVQEVLSATMTIKNNLKENQYVNSTVGLNIGLPINNAVEYTLEARVLMDADTFQDLYETGSDTLGTNEMSLVFARDASNDFVSFVFTGAAFPKAYPTHNPEGEEVIADLRFEPTTLVLTAKDAIDSGFDLS